MAAAQTHHTNCKARLAVPPLLCQFRQEQSCLYKREDGISPLRPLISPLSTYMHASSTSDAPYGPAHRCGLQCLFCSELLWNKLEAAQPGGGTAWRQLSHLQWRFSPTLLKLAEGFINVSDLKWESASICVWVL